MRCIGACRKHGDAGNGEERQFVLWRMVSQSSSQKAMVSRSLCDGWIANIECEANWSKDGESARGRRAVVAGLGKRRAMQRGSMRHRKVDAGAFGTHSSASTIRSTSAGGEGEQACGDSLRRVLAKAREGRKTMQSILFKKGRGMKRGQKGRARFLYEP